MQATKSKIRLTVLVSIFVAILAAATYFALPSHGRNPQIARTKALLLDLTDAQSKLSSQKIAPASLDEFLVAANKDPESARRLSGFVTLDPHRTVSGQPIPMDGFNTPIRFLPSYKTFGPTFQSAGPDHQFDTSDDLFSFDP